MSSGCTTPSAKRDALCLGPVCGGDTALGWGGVAFSSFALAFAVFILGLFIAGWLLRAGHCDIIVGQGQLLTTERVGFLCLSQSGPLEQVRRLVVESCDMTKMGRPVPEGQRTELAGRTELEWLATTLRRELQVPPPDRPPPTAPS